jgi:hypothetical protein
MKFAYVRDPLFLASVAAYFLNRFVLKAIWTDGFLHEHFNDVLCIGFCVPPMLCAMRRLGLRRHDEPPGAMEIIVPLVIWSALFEIVLPATNTFERWTYADPGDVLWYAVGGLAASLFWTWWYAGDERLRHVELEPARHA